MELTEQLIKQCLNEMKRQQSPKQRLYDYYYGKHDILMNYRMNEAMSNEKLVFNYPRKFVNSMTGYSLGKQVNYISKSGNEQITHDIDLHFSSWEKKHNQNLSKYSEIFGVAYEINYVTARNEFRSMVTTPLNTFVIDDGTDERNVELALYAFTKQFDKSRYLDVFYGNKIFHYTIQGQNGLKLIGETEHIFDHVPVNIYMSNEEGVSGFQDIISLVNAYNILNSDLVNEISDHRNAYLTVNGAKLEKDDLAVMKQLGIIQVPTGAKVEWLIKDMNAEFIANTSKNIEEKIYDLCDQVNFNEKWSSNTSSVALRNKLLALSHRCSLKESIMESAMKKRLVNFFKFLKVKEAKNYDYRDISIKFQRDLPFDIQTLADSISKLKDVVSQETLLTLLPFVENPSLELEKYRKEQEFQREQDMKNRIDLDLLNNGDNHGSTE